MDGKPEWFPIAPAAFFYDEAHDGLTTLELGAYFRLLCRQWVDGELPNDQVRLARLSRLTPEEWGECWENLSRCFTPTETGGLVNRWLAERRQDAVRIIEMRSAAGKLGGAARVGKKKMPEKPVPAPATPAQAPAQAPPPPPPPPETPGKAKKAKPRPIIVSPFLASPPPLEEVQAYILEVDAPFTAEEFLDGMTNCQWTHSGGKHPVIDWKATIRTWKRLRGDSPKSKNLAHAMVGKSRMAPEPPGTEAFVPSEEPTSYKEEMDEAFTQWMMALKDICQPAVFDLYFKGMRAVHLATNNLGRTLSVCALNPLYGDAIRRKYMNEVTEAGVACKLMVLVN